MYCWVGRDGTVGRRGNEGVGRGRGREEEGTHTRRGVLLPPSPSVCTHQPGTRTDTHSRAANRKGAALRPRQGIYSSPSIPYPVSRYPACIPLSRIPYPIIPYPVSRALSRLYPFIPYPISHYPVSLIPLSRYPILRIPYFASCIPYPVSRSPYPIIPYPTHPGEGGNDLISSNTSPDSGKPA